MNTAIQINQHKRDLIQFTAQFQLKSQLEAYGLNPNEWRFSEFEYTEPNSSGFAKLYNVNDQNLQLTGTIHREPFSLKSIMKWTWSDLAWDL